MCSVAGAWCELKRPGFSGKACTDGFDHCLLAAGCSFCAGTSMFGAFFMFMLGILIKNNYQ